MAISARAKNFCVLGLCTLCGVLLLFLYCESTPVSPIYSIDLPYLVDLDLSPDGKFVALAGVQDEREKNLHPQATEHSRGLIYDIAGKKLVTEVPDGAVNCAWKTDGSEVAFVSSNWIDTEYLSAGDRTFKSERHGRLRYGFNGGFAYDSEGNLFACVGIPAEFDSRPFPAQVWWVAEGPGQTTSSDFGPLDKEVISIASSPREARIRLALAYSDEKPIDVFGMKIEPDGSRIMREEYKVPLPGAAWVRLTRGGDCLAVLRPDGFRMYRLIEGRTERMFQVLAQTSLTFSPLRQPLDVSLDGERVAFALDNLFEVRSVTDGRQVFKSNGAVISLSLSADGRILATSHAKPPRVRIYELPGREPNR